LVNQPRLILADEPTGNLDTGSGKEIINLFEELGKQGHTVVVITHDHGIAGRTHRIIKLRDGMIVDGNGPPA
jgi:putative ABC transport system ATP-binding protein